MANDLKIKCPKCGAECEADFVDNGVGNQQCGPYVCEACGWIEKQVNLEDFRDDDIAEYMSHSDADPGL